jgi:hypothetical protein
MPRRSDGEQRFQIGDYYLAQPHPDHLGIWYACRYDARARTTRRRSLETADFEAAKIALAALVAAAPAASGQAPAPDQVLSLAILKAYMDGHGATIASEEVAQRAVTLFADYLASILRLDASVAFWTPAQQLECARWLRQSFRPDGLGGESECALIMSAPRITMTETEVMKALALPRRQLRKKPTMDEMAAVLERMAHTEHLFRFALMSLATWARPQAVIDFDPVQVDWEDGAVDLAPVGWVPTNKRRPRQPLTLCLAGWLQAWGEAPLLTYHGERVESVKNGVKRIAHELELPHITQKSFRTFMADQTKKMFTRVSKEHRSLYLGHVVKEGSRTTDFYESDDPVAIEDVALATDCIITLLAEKVSRPLFAIDVRLTKAELTAIGARVLPQKLDKSRKNGGRDRDRTCDPYHVKVVRLADYRAKSTKRRA